MRRVWIVRGAILLLYLPIFDPVSNIIKLRVHIDPMSADQDSVRTEGLDLVMSHRNLSIKSVEPDKIIQVTGPQNGSRLIFLGDRFFIVCNLFILHIFIELERSPNLGIKKYLLGNQLLFLVPASSFLCVSSVRREGLGAGFPDV